MYGAYTCCRNEQDVLPLFGRRWSLGDCMLVIERGKMESNNIGNKFRVLHGREGSLPFGPIRSMTDDELAFHRASQCIECE